MLRLVLRTRWLHAVLAGLLLVAQQGALTHALAHAGQTGHKVAMDFHAHAHSQDTREAHHHHESAPAGDEPGLCTLDLVFSQVLGGVHADHDLVFAAVEQALVVTATLAVSNSVTVVPYDSRGPPVIS